MTVQRSPSLSLGARALRKELEVGESIGIASVYPDSLAFSSHAKIFFSNAAAICRDRGLDDFRIFGALYQIRHGIELWLKCLIRNTMVDEALALIRHPDTTFATLCATLKLKKGARKDAVRGLCALRNYLQDGTPGPACWKARSDDTWAEKAIIFLRDQRISRERFAVVWQPSIQTHSLFPTWQTAKEAVEDLRHEANCFARQEDYPLPMSTDRLAAACELFHGLDPGGDAFRYPSSLDGSWHISNPHFSLTSLGAFAEELGNTVDCFEWARRNRYG